MGNAVIIIVIVVIVVIIVAALTMRRNRRTQGLKERFGEEEYSKAVQETGSTSAAESELTAREERVESFNIVALSDADRQQYATEWRNVQAQFVDNPGGAVSEADSLIQDVMEARGYPTSEFEQRASDISVNYPDVVQNYRAAHDFAQQQEAGSASTDDLRQAMVHYRALFSSLLDMSEADLTPSAATSAQTTAGPPAPADSQASGSAPTSVPADTTASQTGSPPADQQADSPPPSDSSA